MVFRIFLPFLFLPIVALAASEKYSLEISGMTCGACAKAVQSALEKIPNIEKASIRVILKEKKAEFTTQSEDENLNKAVTTAIEEAGYHVAAIHKN